MKSKITTALSSVIIAFGLSATANAADVIVKLSDVHLCCLSCVKGADQAVDTVKGATAQTDPYKKTVVITAPDKATAQKAVDALVAAGFYGTSNNAAVKVTDASGAKDAKVHSLTVTGVHLCCDKCATAASKAVATVPGVTGNTAAKDAESFEVIGDFNAQDVFTALNHAGLAGQAGKSN